MISEALKGVAIAGGAVLGGVVGVASVVAYTAFRFLKR